MVKFIDVLIILLFLLSVYLVLTRVVGHSATDLAVTVGLFGFLGSIVFKLYFVVFNLNREFGEFKIGTINGFGRIKKDMNEIKNDIGEIKNILKK